MKKIKQFLEKGIRQALLIISVAAVIGLLVAFFLWLLDVATITRMTNHWLIFLLPAAGVFIWWLYSKFGENSAAGNSLIIEEIHQSGGGVPARMSPLVLFTTIITHLFGGSAGREGTAVQMGGSTAALFSKWFNVAPEDKKILLLCGIAAGFGAVFGTPIAGAIFALEVVALGYIKYDAFIPCLLASIIADAVCTACGITHTHYAITSAVSFDIVLLLKVVVASGLFGLSAYLFVQVTHFIKIKSKHFVKTEWLIPIVGSIFIIGISYAIGTFDYIGIGVTSADKDGISIVSAFHQNGATYLSWFWKLLLTAITLSMGYKGGEVTPLFFIGATLGNTLAVISGAPIDLLAALGFIAVFAAAANTPLACILMGVELFGADHVVYYAVACFVAYYCSGSNGIYRSKRAIEFKRFR